VFDLDFAKLAAIGGAALIFIGPKKLPEAARTLGALIGKAQRYVADVKAEVNRSMELDELKKMKEEMEKAARDVQSSVQTGVSDFERDWQATAGAITNTITSNNDNSGSATSNYDHAAFQVPLEYKHPKKKWRIKQSAMPQWFKAKSGVRRQALSGAARVARYRPKPSPKLK
jgi:sec-independent protein translocase protein TatB